MFFPLLTYLLQNHKTDGRIVQTTRASFGGLRRFFAHCQRPTDSSHAGQNIGQCWYGLLDPRVWLPCPRVYSFCFLSFFWYSSSHFLGIRHFLIGTLEFRIRCRGQHLQVVVIQLPHNSTCWWFPDFSSFEFVFLLLFFHIILLFVFARAHRSPVWSFSCFSGQLSPSNNSTPGWSCVVFIP